MKLKLALAATLLAAGANAQNFANATTDGNPNNTVRVSVGTLNSGTTPRAVAVGAFDNLFISCVGSAASTSQTVLYQTAQGRTLASESVNCTTTAAVAVSRTAGNAFGASQVVVSPTAGLAAANVVTNTIVRVPGVTR